jgi:hypothetical protein
MISPPLAEAFRIIPATADEAEFYGVWNIILTQIFPFEEGYIVHPQFPAGSVNRQDKDTIDFAIALTVTRNKATVFFVEIKPPKEFRGISARRDADRQMRKRFEQLYNSSPTEMYGVSAFGTRLSFYEMIKPDNVINPAPAAIASELVVVDVAPEAMWDKDILEEDGWAKFTEVTTHVKELGTDERTSLLLSWRQRSSNIKQLTELRIQTFMSNTIVY